MSENKVVPNPNADINGTCRQGTFHARKDRLILALGQPHCDGIDDKTTAEWYFDTPYGTATLHDYWWNSTNEWSIGAASKNAAMALMEYLEKTVK